MTDSGALTVAAGNIIMMEASGGYGGEGEIMRPHEIQVSPVIHPTEVRF